MNILHAVSKQQEVSPKLKKLQASCKEDGPPAVQLEKDELRKQLSPMQYLVTQEKGTERCRPARFVLFFVFILMGRGVVGGTMVIMVMPLLMVVMIIVVVVDPVGGRCH